MTAIPDWKNFALSRLLKIDYPVIMAPMFLVSNANMVIAACNAGITGAIPALNYRTDTDLRKALQLLKAKCKGPVGINLIVNRSNFRFKEQLRTCCEFKVDYFITSLGNPAETIRQAHMNGIKVFCDVTNLEYALKVEGLGADAVIAVNNQAGGHAGTIPPEILIPELKEHLKIPVISAGGVGDFSSLKNILDLGADGVSVGTIFIATDESPVSTEYKQAIVDYGEEDIVMTTKLSGTPCTVINTPYVQEIGTKQTTLESILNKNRRLKKWAKALTFIRGMKQLEKAAFSATYRTVWCAGPTVKYVHATKPVRAVIESLLSPSSHDA